MTCCVCHRNKEAFKTLKLTDEEKTVVARSTGKQAPNELVYCKACWGIATDKIQGAQLIKGLVQLRARSTGVKSPEQLASLVQERMLRKAAKKAVS